MADEATTWDYPIFQTFSEKELFPAVANVSKRLNVPPAPKTEQKIILEDKLQQFLDKGWLYVAPVNHNRCIVQRGAN